MKHAKIAAGILLTATLAACSTGKLALHLEGTGILATTRLPAGGGNGGPRGGGDRVAGEFMEFERIAVAKMQAWKSQGKITLSDSDLAKILELMPPNEQVNPKHVVTSEDHVCINEGKQADGNCLKKEDERDVIKQPFATPPRIMVGRIRWDEAGNTPSKKELTAQHELRGIALSKKGEVFADEAFQQSYELLASASKEWNALIQTHLAYFLKVRFYDEALELVDLSHFDTVIHTVMASTDYNRCVNASDAEVAEINKVETKLARKINRKAKHEGLFSNLERIENAEKDLNNTDAKKACDAAIAQMQEGLLYEVQKPSQRRERERVEAKAGGRTYVEETPAPGEEDVAPIQRQSNEIQKKVQATFDEWQAWANSNQNPGWHNWLFKTAQNYVNARRRAFDKFNSMTPSSIGLNETLNASMDKVCPRSGNKDFRDAARCNITKGAPVANAFFKTLLGKAVDELLAAHDDAVKEIASQVDPI
jgi:hypothetical protein